MSRWAVPVRIVEHGSFAIVEAGTRTQAQEKARQGDWLEHTEPTRYDMTTAGPVQRLSKER